ncbi:MAG: LptF/LptG family permease [Candidatus Zixiibacteriota bacterium]|nr:MAG: LptF/LptG family permease [candidate division Zixibacteria bacterium]
MKILNRYILREHIPPFLFSVFIITFVLILETIPKIVEMVVDKDIPAPVVLELIFLNLAWMIALSVPMAVLVATLLAFGRLTSDTEIVAIKSSGVNLLRVLIPLLIAAGILTAAMVEFNDKVLPDLNHKARVLTGDIRSMRPTLTFRPGVFITDVSGYIILIDDIDHTTSEVEGVRISDVKNPNKPRIIVAKSGLMKFIDNGQTVRFTLRDGEIHMLDSKEPDNYRRIGFTEQVINVGGVGSELQRSSSNFRTDREMDIAEMREVVLRAKNAIEPFRQRIEKSVANKMQFLFSDTLDYPVDTSLTDARVLSFLKTDMKAILGRIERDTEQIEQQNRNINKYMSEIHKKYAIPAASFAFVLIGAPLAILSRRGGMGVAVSISLFIFTLYWAFLIGGEDLSDRGLISPFWAMWSANFLVGAIGLYLLIKVLTEKPLLSFFRR